jgi:hypothetical protein
MCWMFYLKDACTVLTYFWIKVKNDVGMLKCKSILSWCDVLISWATIGQFLSQVYRARFWNLLSKTE